MIANKRFKYYEHKGADYILENPNEDLDFIEMLGDCLEAEEIVDKLNELAEENEQLKQDIENLKITIDARETLIDVCEKKFNELGFIITVDDDGYVIE